MKTDTIPTELASEYEQLEEIWFTYPEGTPFEAVVKEHGSNSFQEHFFKMMEQHRKLRAKGIFVN
ncbi:MAG: hypothetical protein IKF39_02115 [Oscillospiraceae bacterium]|nr:hypothetical protein [Oscillospiraceae bacterium]